MSDWQLSLLWQWYDRNPISIERSYYGDNLPHTSTQRWSYTVPSGKKAILEICFAVILRVSAAETADEVIGGIWIQPSGSSNVAIVYTTMLTNNVGDMDKTSLGQSLTLKAGDILQAITQDLGTGGLIRYRIAAKITEFDANPPKSYIYVRDPTPKPDIQQPRKIDDPPM